MNFPYNVDQIKLFGHQSISVPSFTACGHLNNLEAIIWAYLMPLDTFGSGGVI